MFVQSRKIKQLLQYTCLSDLLLKFPGLLKLLKSTSQVGGLTSLGFPQSPPSPRWFPTWHLRSAIRLSLGLDKFVFISLFRDPSPPWTPKPPPRCIPQTYIRVIILKCKFTFATDRLAFSGFPLS